MVEWFLTAWWLPLAVAPFVGGLLGAVVARPPVGAPLPRDSAPCAACGTVPAIRGRWSLAGWMRKRGRCRVCGAAIDWLDPVMALAALAVAAWASAVQSGPAVWLSCALGWTLLPLALNDLRHFILPNGLVLPLLAAGLVYAAASGPQTLIDHAVGAAVGAGLLAAIAQIYRRVRGYHGLGLGDVKLVAAAGAWVSWSGLPDVVAVAAGTALMFVAGRAVAGLPVGRREPIPFGAALCFGLWVVWLHGPPLAAVASLMR